MFSVEYKNILFQSYCKEMLQLFKEKQEIYVLKVWTHVVKALGNVSRALIGFNYFFSLGSLSKPLMDFNYFFCGNSFIIKLFVL